MTLEPTRAPSRSALEKAMFMLQPAASPHATPLSVPIPAGHVGPVTLPGTGRTVWWTGRVAIGLRHEPSRAASGLSQSADWIQRVLLGTSKRAAVTV